MSSLVQGPTPPHALRFLSFSFFSALPPLHKEIEGCGARHGETQRQNVHMEASTQLPTPHSQGILKRKWEQEEWQKWNGWRFFAFIFIVSIKSIVEWMVDEVSGQRCLVWLLGRPVEASEEFAGPVSSRNPSKMPQRGRKITGGRKNLEFWAVWQHFQEFEKFWRQVEASREAKWTKTCGNPSKMPGKGPKIDEVR